MTRSGLPDLKLLEDHRAGGLIIAVGAVIGVLVAAAVILLALGPPA